MTTKSSERKIAGTPNASATAVLSSVAAEPHRLQYGDQAILQYDDGTKPLKVVLVHQTFDQHKQLPEGVLPIRPALAIFQAIINQPAGYEAAIPPGGIRVTITSITPNIITNP